MKMRTLMASAVLLCSCAAGQTASTPPEDPKVTKALAGKVAGEPRDCISVSDTRSSSTYRGTILYRTNAKLTYRNDVNNCAALDDDKIIVTRIYTGQICRGEIISLIDRSSNFPSGACTYGKFVPYRTAGGAG